MPGTEPHPIVGIVVHGALIVAAIHVFLPSDITFQVLTYGGAVAISIVVGLALNLVAREETSRLVALKGER